MRQEAQAVYDRLMNDKEDFATVAKEVSQNKETASKGGMVEFFSRGTKEKPYEQAAMRLKEDGDISGIIELKDGFAILQRVARKEPVYKSLSSVKHDISTLLRDQKFKRTFADEAQQITRSLTETAFDDFIKEHHGKKEMIALVDRSEGNVASRLFALRREGEKACYIQDGNGYVIQLDEKVERKLPALTDIEDKVKHDYFKYKGAKALDRQLEKSRTEAVAAGDLVACDGSKISSTDFIHPDNKEKIADLVKQGFPENFVDLDHEGAMVAGKSEQGGVLVFLKNINNFSESAYAEKLKDSYRSAHQKHLSLFSRSYIASLYRTATIKINEELTKGKESPL